LEPKPNEPRGDILLPTVGHVLAFIGSLEHPDMVGLNPEFAHETMSGLSFSHAVAQTLWHDKLFHIDLNGQRIGKFDQDFRFGSEGIRDAFYVVKLLEDAHWDGMRHFDAHPYRTEDSDGVWDFARGCMRTYLILADKARRFHEDAEIQDALRAAKAAELAEPTSGEDGLEGILSSDYAEDGLAAQGYGNERLDQLVTELLLGVR
jgi:xylose isomerase